MSCDTEYSSREPWAVDPFAWIDAYALAWHQLLMEQLEPLASEIDRECGPMYRMLRELSDG